jgi:hypothetical protein
LKPDFADYLTMLIRLFNCVTAEPKSYKATLQILKDNTSVLYFNQILDFKSLTLFSCSFEVEDEDRVKMHIKYRHKLAKVEYAEMESRLFQVC